MDIWVDQLLDALADLEDADPSLRDVDVTATLATGELWVDVCLEANDLGDAGQKLVATVRTALHEIGGDTQGWEHAARALHDACTNVRPTSLQEFADA
jgi:hypothetical protein